MTVYHNTMQDHKAREVKGADWNGILILFLVAGAIAAINVQLFIQ